MKRHLQHFAYVARRKALYVHYGRRLGVSWAHILVHDLYFFRPRLWRLGATVFHGPDAEQWVLRRAAEILEHLEHPGQREEDEAVALRIAKDEHTVYARQMQELSDLFSLHAQRKPWRWEAYIVRDLSQVRKVEMPERWVRAMLADWCAGAIMSGAPKDKVFAQVRMYFVKNHDAIQLHPNTKKLVRSLLEGLK